jgi:hypothetical protein
MKPRRKEDWNQTTTEQSAGRSGCLRQGHGRKEKKCSQVRINQREPPLLTQMLDTNEFLILHVGVMHMVHQRRILALLLSLFLTLGAGPAWAVSFIGSFGAESQGGDVRRDLTPTSTTFCILSQINVRDTDTVEELGSCSEEDVVDEVNEQTFSVMFQRYFWSQLYCGFWYQEV